jgi:hypothetical protein
MAIKSIEGAVKDFEKEQEALIKAMEAYIKSCQVISFCEC